MRSLAKQTLLEKPPRKDSSAAALRLEETIRNAEEKLESGEATEQLDTAGVASKASELAELVDEMLTAIQSEEVRSALADGAEMADSADLSRESRDTQQSQSIAEGPQPMLEPPISSDEGGEEQKSAPPAEFTDKSVTAHEAHDPLVSGPTVVAQDTAAVSVQEVAQHEEALRYLLRHLKEIKDRV